MTSVDWTCFPLVAQNRLGYEWLSSTALIGLAENTIEAYGRCIEDYFAFCTRNQIIPENAQAQHIALYVRDMATRPQRARVGLANATMQQRLTVLRLYYDYLIEESLRTDSPIRRGHYTPGTGFGNIRDKGLIPRYRKLPWIPNHEQWETILNVAREEPIRNRMMLALAYDSALRREELCSLRVDDVDPAHRLLRIRAETTKNRQERIVPYSAVTGDLYKTYLTHRRTISRNRGAIFLSESLRNYGQPISIWTWSKVITSIAKRAGMAEFTTHTLRHLCLTDLARADWDIHAIAQFAGHRSIQSTLIYIHLSARELSAKLESSLQTLHSWRVNMITELGNA